MTPREQIEWIQDDVSRLCEERMRLPKLVYAVAVTDHNALIDSMRSACGSKPHTNDGRLWLHVGSTPVEVIGFEHWPVGHEPQRLYRCSPCGALFLDDSSRSGKCGACLGSGVLVDSLTGPQRALETSFGPIPLRADPTLKPDEVVWAALNPKPEDTPEWVRSAVASVQKQRTDYLTAKTPRDSVVATKCARCDVTFQGETDAELSAALTAHAERCFVVGDYVRWWPDGSDADGLAMAHRWIDGTVEALRDRHITGLRITGSHGFAERALGHGWILPALGAVMDTTVSPGTIRRTTATCHACGLKYDSSEADVAAHRARCPGYDRFVKAMEHLAAPIRKTAPASPREWVKPVATPDHAELYADLRRDLGSPTIPVLEIELSPRPDGFDPLNVEYDGLTAMQCYMRWADNRACIDHGAPPLYKLTPAQIEVGRRAYQQDSLNEWADELRAKIRDGEARDKARQVSVVVDGEVD